MNNDRKNQSRVDRFEKKRRSTNLITVLGSLGGVLVIVLLAIFLFGGEENNEPQQQTLTDQQESNGSNTQESTETDDQGNEPEPDETEEDQSAEQPAEEEEENQEEEEEGEENDSSETQEDNTNLEKQQLETPDDPNVKEVYTADWEPVGTSQQEPHQVVIDQNTQEWAEIMKAVSLATGLHEQNMTAWWVTMAGEQQVEATVSNSNETEIYRVYLQWVTGEGYRPERVEVLEENDRKNRS